MRRFALPMLVALLGTAGLSVGCNHTRDAGTAGPQRASERGANEIGPSSPNQTVDNATRTPAREETSK